MFKRPKFEDEEPEEPKVKSIIGPSVPPKPSKPELVKDDKTSTLPQPTEPSTLKIKKRKKFHNTNFPKIASRSSAYLPSTTYSMYR